MTSIINITIKGDSTNLLADIKKAEKVILKYRIKQAIPSALLHLFAGIGLGYVVISLARLLLGVS